MAAARENLDKTTPLPQPGDLGSVDPETGILVPLFHPRTQQWSDASPCLCAKPRRITAAEDEDGLARIEHTLSQLQQGARDGFVEVYKQLDSIRRDDERQYQHLQREMSTQTNQLQVRLDDLHRRFTDLQGRLTSAELAAEAEGEEEA